MSHSIGVIFHNNWKDFSPLLYSHYGADLIPVEVQKYSREYYKEHDINNEDNLHDGHLYAEDHMMFGFIQSIDKDIHDRIENLDMNQINILKDKHELPNCFDGGIWIININPQNYGETVGDEGKYYIKGKNILNDLGNREEDLYNDYSF